MYNLPLESKLDIFKHLNINQLTSVRQTNNYFNALIGRYEGELARKKLYSIEITECSQDYNYKSINPQDGVFHFKITSQLMEKWNSVVDSQIPVCLYNIGRNQKVIRFYKGPGYNSSFNLNLPTIPKNIEEIRIIRCWFEKISLCYFDNFMFFDSIFNPEFIQFIFENEEIDKIKFNCQKCRYLCVRDETILMFYLNRLIINESITLCFDYSIDKTFNQQSINILFKFLLKIPNIYINKSLHSALCKIILNYIETSKNYSNMFNYIKFNCVWSTFNLSERAEFIERERVFI